MNVEHFISGSFNGLGHRTIRTQGVEHLLDPSSQQHLESLDGAGSKYTFLPHEQALAVTFLTPQTDELGRKTKAWNHTLLIHLPDLVEYLRTHAIGPLATPPKTLKEITL